MTHFVDENGNRWMAKSDQMNTGALVVIESAHNKIHCGDSYEATYNVTLGSGESAEILMTVPNDTATGYERNRYHMVIAIETAGEAEITLYNDSDSTGGTAIASHNRDHESTNDDSLTIAHTPTITTDGTLKFGPVRAGSGRTGAGSISRTMEYILKNNSKYLLRVDNNVVGDNNINIEFDYYVSGV